MVSQQSHTKTRGTRRWDRSQRSCLSKQDNACSAGGAAMVPAVALFLRADYPGFISGVLGMWGALVERARRWPPSPLCTPSVQPLTAPDFPCRVSQTPPRPQGLFLQPHTLLFHELPPRGAAPIPHPLLETAQPFTHPEIPPGGSHPSEPLPHSRTTPWPLRTAPRSRNAP